MAVPDHAASAITFIVAGIGTMLERPGNVNADNQLAMLAGRGTVRREWDRRVAIDHAAADLYAWQRGLLALLELDAKDYPSAPVSASGANDLSSLTPQVSLVQDKPDYWLHAEPVHFAAGLDSLTFMPLTDVARVSNAERAVLGLLLQEHLQGSPLQLHIAGSQWLIRVERALDVITVSPETAAANELGAVMPRGEDAGELRRAMTEWQMVLHEHAVSERRVRYGLPPINALWPWGGGMLKQVTPRSLPEGYADNAFVRGLYRLHGHTVQALPANATELLERTRSLPIVAVLETQDVALLERDWIAPLAKALRAGVISQLDLVLDEWRIHVTRGMLRRFWRKPLLPLEWVQ